ncbi:class I SAM-dependent methyltransferase [Nocardioides sp. T2.26MG-1]|uniref:class I SAM-dependent methyltransferase n=1 Tax=Nocardioides sp. T2.26MG-1 TaxID=3041166 RepID=UPI0024774E64|nr:class I SAM-dependent methyltransferase [Nocardioides sp. T2.26MG-1]CAI9414573.1 2-methoxy-6-polyprenyl-1,4-benzoquinol methylase, mitochondrial [Nocardioides sp. T2.26MG-1]
MGYWTDRVLPRLTERTLSTPDIRRLRAEVCAGLHGRVLEIGFGTGLNIPVYPAVVDQVDAVEPTDVAWEMSARRRAGSRVPIERTGLDGERLAAADGQYDAVLSTFSLCTIPDVERALREVRRVLRPGGSFHFAEHGLAPDRRVERWQHRLDPLQRRLGGGCHLSRDIPGLVAGSGLDVVEVAAAYLPGPLVSRPWTHGFVGRAVKR